jgi:hypothetical protein
MLSADIGYYERGYCCPQFLHTVTAKYDTLLQHLAHFIHTNILSFDSAWPILGSSEECTSFFPPPVCVAADSTQRTFPSPRLQVRALSVCLLGLFFLIFLRKGKARGVGGCDVCSIGRQGNRRPTCYSHYLYSYFSWPCYRQFGTSVVNFYTI